KKLQVHLNNIQDLIKNTPAPKSFLEKCLKGQRKVQTYLYTSEATTLIQKTKEKELRWSAALGEFDMVETLLHEGVNPMSQDVQERSPLDYAVSRFEVVKERLRAVYAEKAQPLAKSELLEKS